MHERVKSNISEMCYFELRSIWIVLFSIFLRWRWFPTCLRSLWRRWLQSMPVMPLYWLQRRLRFAFLFSFHFQIFLLCNSILLSNLRRRTRLEICSETQRRRPQIRNERGGRRSCWSVWRLRSVRRDRNSNRFKVERITRKGKQKLNRPSRNLLKEEKPKYLRLVTKFIWYDIYDSSKGVQRRVHFTFPYISPSRFGLQIFLILIIFVISFSCRMMAWIRLFVPLKHFSHNYKTKLKARSRGPRTRRERKRNKKKFLWTSWNYNNVVCHVICTVFLFRRTQNSDISCHFYWNTNLNSCVCVSVLF